MFTSIASGFTAAALALALPLGAAAAPAPAPTAPEYSTQGFVLKNKTGDTLKFDSASGDISAPQQKTLAPGQSSDFQLRIYPLTQTAGTALYDVMSPTGQFIGVMEVEFTTDDGSVPWDAYALDLAPVSGITLYNTFNTSNHQINVNLEPSTT